MALDATENNNSLVSIETLKTANANSDLEGPGFCGGGQCTNGWGFCYDGGTYCFYSTRG